MKNHKDKVIAIGMLIVITLLTIVGTILESRRESPIPMLSTSTQPTGGKALRLWLEQLDYSVDTQTLSRFAIPDGTSLVLMLQPTELVTSQEAYILEQWVDQGGTLLLATQFAPQIGALQERFGFDITLFFEGYYDDVVPQTPLLRQMSPWDSAELNNRFVLTDLDSRYTVLLSNNDKPIVAAAPIGEGMLIVTTEIDAFTNSGLLQEDNGQLVLNLIGLNQAVEEGSIWFNDWHHAVRLSNPTGIDSVNDWMRRSWIGRGLLYTFFIGIGLIIWQGRRFGRSRPLPSANQTRTPIEYVEAMAKLNQTSNNRKAVMDDYHLRLKRKLGTRYHVDPALPDATFLADVKMADPEIDQQAIGTLLHQLSNRDISDKQMIEVAQAVSAFLQPASTDAERLT